MASCRILASVAAHVLPIVEADLKRSAMRIVGKTKELCAQAQLADAAVYEVVEGDARNVLCEAVERHHAEMLAVGSHSYGAIKRSPLLLLLLRFPLLLPVPIALLYLKSGPHLFRAVLGSVSDYCAHHAHCTVMIVKKPTEHHKH
jgi:nucleotide-binding universal stress UspA family protein